MKLKDYIKELKKLAKQYPDATVIYSSDEEGNGFNEVYYSPGKGTFDKEMNEFEYTNDAEVNAVCLN